MTIENFGIPKHVRELLEREFDAEDIEYLPKTVSVKNKTALALPYIKKPAALKRMRDAGLRVKLTCTNELQSDSWWVVKARLEITFKDEQGEMATEVYEDQGEARARKKRNGEEPDDGESEIAKAATTDAQKRVLALIGIGTGLAKLDKEWRACELSEKGNFLRWAKDPKAQARTEKRSETRTEKPAPAPKPAEPPKALTEAGRKMVDAKITERELPEGFLSAFFAEVGIGSLDELNTSTMNQLLTKLMKLPRRTQAA